MGATYKEREKTIGLTLQHTHFLDNTEDPRLHALTAGVMLLVGLVLLVACANIANMMLARGARRQAEIGVRLALGASRSRVVRQLLTESVLLGLAGGAAGLALAAWSCRVLWVWIEGELLSHVWGSGVRMPVDAALDLRVLIYAIAISIAAGVVFGLSPALQATRPVVAQQRRSRLRSWLVAAQVAVSMMLLITAGLLTRGLLRSRIAGAGFDTRNLYMMTGDLGADPVVAANRQRRLLDRIRLLPEVTQATTGQVPLLGTWTPPMVSDIVQGRTLASYGSETYLDTVGIPLLRGRGFTAQEVARNAAVAVISESAARTFWPGRDAIGRRFQLDMDFRGTMTAFDVIGIAKDVRSASLSRIDPAHVFLPLKPAQLEPALIRITGDPRLAQASIRAAVRQADPDFLPGLTLMSMDEGPVWLQKLQAQAMAVGASILASLALLLAGVGIYGVMAYLVGQRTKEIGIRMALGAVAGDVVRAVIAAGLRPVFWGAAVGMAGAAVISSALHATLRFPGSADFLYGVRFYDPVSFLALAAFLFTVAIAASAIPAHRAARVDPVTALRHE
jgi:putative ABC transport system permease protein